MKQRKSKISWTHEPRNLLVAIDVYDVIWWFCNDKLHAEKQCKPWGKRHGVSRGLVELKSFKSLSNYQIIYV